MRGKRWCDPIVRVMKTSIRDLLSPAVLMLCVLRPIQVSAQAGTGEAVLFVGPRHVFSLTAPRGWILDVRSDRNNGLPGVLYRKGTTWEHSAAAMYVASLVASFLARSS